jgi:hypothetical protein
MVGYGRITKHQFHLLGGLSNPRLARRQSGQGNKWTYWIREG